MDTVISINELKAMADGEIVELPPFSAGQKFVAKLRRPSIMKLVQSGKIPNSLLTAANVLFAGDVGRELDIDEDFLKSMYEVIEIMAEATFVEPTWKEIQDADIQLTDQQYMFIFNYSQYGVNQLQSFREEQTNSKSVDNGENV